MLAVNAYAGRWITVLGISYNLQAKWGLFHMYDRERGGIKGLVI